MKFTEAIDAKLKELFEKKAFSKEELNILAELMTHSYEEGYKQGFADRGV